MKKWIKQNFNLTIIATLITYAAMGVATAAVLRSDVERLKHDNEGVPAALARIEQHDTDLQKSVDRIEERLIGRRQP